MKKLLAILAVTLSSATIAEEGTWEDREVCDYESIETAQGPITVCQYEGHVTAFHKGYYQARKTYLEEVKDGNVSCEDQIHHTEYSSQFYPEPPLQFTGTLSLAMNYSAESGKITTNLIEGSCRIEQVLMPPEVPALNLPGLLPVNPALFPTPIKPVNRTLTQ